MKLVYIFILFSLCFILWAVVVDNLIIPESTKLHSEFGKFSRYRIKTRKVDGQRDFMKDQLIVYAHTKGRERFYYMDRIGYFELALKSIEPGSQVEMRYSRAFPKIWQRSLYEVRKDGLPVARYGSAYLIEKKKFTWKFSGIMLGAFCLLSSLGFLRKPGRK